MDIGNKENLVNKYKAGEKEAIAIMEGKGFEFDKMYHDDNSKASMPDLKLLNGQFIEVTHTMHNFKDWNTPNRFYHKSLKERLKIMNEAQKAYDRLLRDDYENNETGENERKRDGKILKSYNGYDFDTHVRSEFNCALKGTSFSPNNVLNEIINDKGEKYPGGNVDLFIFVLKEELNSVINRKEYFLKKAQKSPFKTIYLCVWDMHNNYYEIKNPEMIKINLGVNPPSISNF